MKKMLLLGAALMALSFIPANAAGLGCTATGAAQDASTSCTYTATGAGQYVAATPNTWSITVVRDGETVTLASGETGPPSTGSFASAAGELVTVTMGPDCVPGDFVCGSIGTVTAVETA